MAAYMATLNEGEASPFILLPSGEYMSLIVHKITPKKQPAFQEIKEKIAKVWEQKEHKKQADQKADAIITLIQKSMTLEEAAKENQAKIHSLEVNFNQSSEKIDVEILKVLISLTPGQSTVVRSKDMSTLVYLDKIEKIVP